MNKKQTLFLSLLTLGVGTSSPTPLSATQALDSLAIEPGIESRAKCAPYSECEPFQEISLPASEEKAIQRDISALNALNIISVAGLTRTEAPTSGYCYGQPCPGDLEAARNVKREKAAKLSRIVEALTE